MLYFCRRLHKPAPFDLNEFLDFLLSLALQIEKTDDSTWKIWDIVQVLEKDDNQSLVYSMNSKWQPLEMVAKASPCYLYTQQIDREVVFTLLAAEEESLTNVQCFIESSCAPVESKDLNEFLH